MFEKSFLWQKKKIKERKKKIFIEMQKHRSGKAKKVEAPLLIQKMPKKENTGIRK